MNSPLPDILTGTETFMRASGQAIAAVPPRDLATELDDTVRELRRELLMEETQEYYDGETDDDLVAIVDGLLDTIVIAWGSLLAYIGPAAAVAAAGEVTRSNLAKIVDGSVVRRADGKVLKPAGWTPPDIAGALATARDATVECVSR